MNDREARRQDMFGRVQTFGNANAADFAAGSKAAGHFARLAQIVRDLDVEKARQDGGPATAKEVLFDSLRLDLQGIARTARAIDAGEPGFADRFRSPAGANQQALLTAADAFARELADPAVAARFLAYELPADFVADLADDIAAIRSADADMQSDDQTGVASTAAVGRLIREGMAEVMQLDAIMNNKYARNRDRMRAWDSASHIDRAARRAKKPAGGTPPASTKAAG
ncbi:MAG: hypothetical protein NFW17_01290 [Candidatus Accumulibacter sp.]|uniref:hypothetical protein n=1 Tax=Accumulibacter sp. TaxID=2053492 RepID=UPI0025DEB385|nr:hypothetical protein [Accumulibacter sp.]MCM8610712.1 hypothetical protein [Accumulibacter sp.]